MTRLRLNEEERDLLRAANNALEAAQGALAQAEANWKAVLNHVLEKNDIQSERMETLVLEDDMKWLRYEEKTDGDQALHQDR